MRCRQDTCDEIAEGDLACNGKWTSVRLKVHQLPVAYYILRTRVSPRNESAYLSKRDLGVVDVLGRGQMRPKN